MFCFRSASEIKEGKIAILQSKNKMEDEKSFTFSADRITFLLKLLRMDKMFYIKGYTRFPSNHPTLNVFRFKVQEALKGGSLPIKKEESPPHEPKDSDLGDPKASKPPAQGRDIQQNPARSEGEDDLPPPDDPQLPGRAPGGGGDPGDYPDGDGGRGGHPGGRCGPGSSKRDPDSEDERSWILRTIDGLLQFFRDFRSGSFFSAGLYLGIAIGKASATAAAVLKSLVETVREITILVNQVIDTLTALRELFISLQELTAWCVIM